MRAAFKYLGLFLLLSIAGFFVFMIPAAILWAVLGLKGSFFHNPWVEDFALAGSQLFCFYVFWKRRYCDYRIGQDIHTSSLYLWLAMGCIGFLLLDIVCMNYIPVPEWEIEIIDELEASMGNPFGIISICILAPLMEEGICRGAILRRLLEKPWKPWVGIVVSALIFAVMHFNFSQGIGAFTMGLFLGWIYYRTRNLWPCIFIHALNNTLCTVIYLLFPEFEFADTLSVMMPLLAISLVMIWLAVKQIRPMYFPKPEPLRREVPVGEMMPPPIPPIYIRQDVPVGEPLADYPENGIPARGVDTGIHQSVPVGDPLNENKQQDS